jgi:hypothetical protein
VREVDCQPALNIRRSLVTCRWLVSAWLVFTLTFAGDTALKNRVVIAPAIITLGTAVAHEVFSGSRTLEVAEGLSSVAALLTMIVVGVLTSARALSDFESLWWFVPLALCVYGTARFLSPPSSDVAMVAGSVTRIFENRTASDHRVRLPERSWWWLLVAAGGAFLGLRCLIFVRATVRGHFHGGRNGRRLLALHRRATRFVEAPFGIRYIPTACHRARSQRAKKVRLSVVSYNAQ